MEVINGLLLPPERKSGLVRAMFRMLARKYLNISAMQALKPLRHGALPGSPMFLDKRDMLNLRRHGARLCSRLKDRSPKRGRVLYWVYIILP